MASLYWPGTIAILGGGIIRFTRILDGQMSGYACAYRAAKEQDLTLGMVRRELLRVLQAENRKLAEKNYCRFGPDTEFMMPLPYSPQQKAKFEENVSGLAVYEPSIPWEWSMEDAKNEYLEALEKKQKKKKEAASDSLDSQE